MKSPLAEDRLMTLALSALEEAAATSREAPARRSWGLRLALAFLASRGPSCESFERWPFDQFWRALVHPRSNGRSGMVTASLNAIYLSLGRRRDIQMVSAFERQGRDAGISD